MNYSIKISPKAKSDLREVFAWYDEISPSKGDEFLDEFQAFSYRIAENPYFYMATTFPGIRRALMKQFPYKIIFQVREKTQRVNLIAIVHKSRHPNVWIKRVQ